MNRRIIKLTESDLIRIVKRVIQEQVKPTPPKPNTSSGTQVKPTPPKSNTSSGTTPPNKLINKTVNLYLDLENKKFDEQIKISNVRGATGSGSITILDSKNRSYVFNCNEANKLSTLIGGGKLFLYNSSFTTELKKQYCTENKSGVVVPKADFAQIDNNQTTDFA